MLSPKEQAKLAELRGFLATEIAPYAADWWNKAEFPAHILPKARGPGAEYAGRSAATATCSPDWSLPR